MLKDYVYDVSAEEGEAIIQSLINMGYECEISYGVLLDNFIFHLNKENKYNRNYMSIIETPENAWSSFYHITITDNEEFIQELIDNVFWELIEEEM